MRYISILTAGTVVTLGLAGCDVKQTQEGEVDLPKYAVQKTEDGQVKVPQYEVTTPDVTVDSKNVEVTVPKVTTERKTVVVPDIDVKTAKEKEAERATR
jgi:hypothetical protein